MAEPEKIETLKGVPKEKVERIMKGFKRDGADPVTKTPESGDTFTIVAVFKNVSH